MTPQYVGKSINASTGALTNNAERAVAVFTATNVNRIVLKYGYQMWVNASTEELNAPPTAITKTASDEYVGTTNLAYYQLIIKRTYGGDISEDEVNGIVTYYKNYVKPSTDVFTPQFVGYSITNGSMPTNSARATAIYDGTNTTKIKLNKEGYSMWVKGASSKYGTSTDLASLVTEFEITQTYAYYQVVIKKNDDSVISEADAKDLLTFYNS